MLLQKHIDVTLSLTYLSSPADALSSAASPVRAPAPSPSLPAVAAASHSSADKTVTRLAKVNMEQRRANIHIKNNSELR